MKPRDLIKILNEMNPEHEITRVIVNTAQSVSLFDKWDAATRHSSEFLSIPKNSPWIRG